MKCLRLAPWAFLLLVVGVLGLPGCISIPSGADAEEAKNITEALEKRYHFPVMSKFEPGKPAAGARPGAWENYVTIIGVVERAEQDKVIAILRDIRATIAKKPIWVRFYREEIITVTKTDPVTGRVLGAHRDEVDLLRELRIK